MLPVPNDYPALGSSERWYLVHALPKGERKAVFHLGAQGFKTFLPQFRKTVRHARQLKTVAAPLFPRYLFIRLNLERDRWLSVRSTLGVSTLITCMGRPAPIPPGVVEALIAQSEGGLVQFGASLVEGQSVRIVSGPFADFVGTLARLDDAGRVRVLLELMGTTVPVSIHRSVLLPAA